MARTFFLMLLLLNALALAWIYAKGDDRRDAGREPLRAQAQFAADRIRLVAMADDTVSAGSGVGLSQTPSATSAASAAGETCHAYAGATIKEAPQLVQTLAARLPDARVSAVPVVPPTSYDVAITGIASHPLAETRLADLKKRGITEGASILAEEDQRFSVIVASFAERRAAEDAIKANAKKGIAALAIVERKPLAEKSVIEIRGADSALKKLPEQMAAFKNLSPTTCAPH